MEAGAKAVGEKASEKTHDAKAEGYKQKATHQ